MEVASAQDVKSIIIRKNQPESTSDIYKDTIIRNYILDTVRSTTDPVQTSSIIGSWQFSINMSKRKTIVEPGFDTTSHSIGAYCMFRENGTYKVWKPNTTIETGNWKLSEDNTILVLSNRKIKKGQDKYYLSKEQNIVFGINNKFTLIEKEGKKQIIIAFSKINP